MKLEISPKDIYGTHLRMNVNLHSELRKQIELGLNLPYHWRLPRPEARWHIQNYAKMKNHNPKILELAKLDYNICQARYLDNVKSTYKWWNHRGLATQLFYSRDRIPESFLWGQSIAADPMDDYTIEMLTIVSQLITTIDDSYDAYGSIEELELFTSAIERWDLKALEELPEYLKRLYLVTFNFTNEMAYTTFKLQGHNIISYLQNFWADLCKSLLQEAKWSKGDYKPSYDEYMINAWVSGSGPLLLASAFFTMNLEITKERLALLDHDYPDLIKASSNILRILNDLGTVKVEAARGEIIQISDKETLGRTSKEKDGMSTDRGIDELWQKMNKHLILGSTLPKELVVSSMGLARISHWYYKYGDGFGGDGFGSQRERTFNLFKSIAIEPIP